jgi:hypothetical protein
MTSTDEKKIVVIGDINTKVIAKILAPQIIEILTKDKNA